MTKVSLAKAGLNSTPSRNVAKRAGPTLRITRAVLCLQSVPIHPWLRYTRLRRPIGPSRHGPRQTLFADEQRTDDISNHGCTEVLRPANPGQTQHEIVLSPIGKL